MATIKDEIAKNIVYYRKKAGLKQRELADLLGVKDTAVSSWEGSRNGVEIETLLKICKILGVSIYDMYGPYAVYGPEPTLAERRLLSDFRKLPADWQEAILKLVDLANGAKVN